MRLPATPRSPRGTVPLALVNTIRIVRPEILARIPRGRHAVIEASAGTGKTWTLEHLILDLLLADATVTIEQILVVTFTEKATSELRMRVRKKLEELLAAGPDPVADALPDARCWVIDPPARARLTRALHSFDSAPISTIHAFCQRVLTEHAFAGGRLFEQTQVDGHDAFGRAFRQVLRERFAADHEYRPWLRAALDSRLSVEELELQLFKISEKRVAELRPRFDPDALRAAASAFPIASLDDPATALELPWATSLAGALHRFLEGGHPAALVGALTAIAALSTKKSVSPAARRLQTAAATLASATVELRAAIAQIFLPPVQELLRRHKREAGQFDFDDMLTLVRDNLVGDGGGALAAILRERYRYALIDEFQDTDEVQWAIFRKLFFEPGGASGGKNLMVLIGDPKQAIYAFRGADVQTYLAARSEVVEAPDQLLHLATNYRSTGAMIEAYNAIFAGPFFTGAIDYRHPVACGDPDLAAVDRDGRPIAPIQLLQCVGDPLRSEIIWDGLAAAIAREIGDLLGPRPITLRQKGRDLPVREGDIYVLTRTDREGRTVGDALREAGIPHSYYKQEGLWKREEAEHVLDLLAAIDDPHLPSLRFRAWLTPFFGLSLADLRACKEVPEGHPLVRRLLDWHTLAERKSYDQLFARIVEESGLVRREVFQKESERELTNYLHLFEILLEEVGRTRCTLRELCFTLRGYIEGRKQPPGENGGVQRLETERDAVQIMTIHKAKGLEAKVVFLAGGFFRGHGRGDGLRVYHLGGHLPGNDGGPDSAGRRVAWIGHPPDDVKRVADSEDDEEEQRVLYVALTRAQARLYLPYFAPGVKRVPERPYKVVNDRLRALAPGFAAVPHLFGVTVVPCPAPPAAARPGLAGRSLRLWKPPTKLLASDEPKEDFAAMRERHRGFTVTSYTRMRGAHAGWQAPREEEAEDFKADAEAPEEAGRDDELPGGRAVGVFLHALIEAVDLAALRAAGSLEVWRALPSVGDLLRTEARRHGIDERHLPRAAELVHTTLTVPVRLGAHAIDGLGSAARSLREVEFLYPIPEAGARAIASLAELRVEKGFVKGFVDYVFEHEGLLYFADWKSDLLPRAGAARIRAHVERNYLLQAQLYSLALVKMLGVTDEADYEARFGGLLYCFLRAMRSGPGGDGSDGVYFDRPTWATLRAWEQELAARPLGGARE